jgi:hypothetical protein
VREIPLAGGDVGAGSGDAVLARAAWFEAHRDDLLAFLR